MVHAETSNAERPTELRILLVEDNEHDCIAFKRVMRACTQPYTIQCCERASEALAVLAVLADNQHRVDRETLAVETIAAAGPGGHFMASKHTRRHMREVQWRPTILNRQGRESWLADGGLDLAARARAKAMDLLATHEAPPLPTHVSAAAERLIAEFAAATN